MHGPLLLSELIGTGLLVLVGLSLVIAMFGTGSPLVPGALCCAAAVVAMATSASSTRRQPATIVRSRI